MYFSEAQGISHASGVCVPLLSSLSPPVPLCSLPACLPAYLPAPFFVSSLLPCLFPAFAAAALFPAAVVAVCFYGAFSHWNVAGCAGHCGMVLGPGRRVSALSAQDCEAGWSCGEVANGKMLLVQLKKIALPLIASCCCWLFPPMASRATTIHLIVLCRSRPARLG